MLDEEGLRDNFLASQNNRKKESFYFLTNIDNGHLANALYKKRFKIETLFRDTKTKGFQLHKTQITDLANLSRLLILVSLAYIYVSLLGAEASRSERFLKHLLGYNANRYSFLQIGFIVFEYLSSHNEYVNDTY